ncbi:rhodanese-like domain-containing protein [Nocardioides agariphilus]|uniref:Rhodanese-like domain-containing protein n=1 Tax=Nocardioides agariphilus TaxID=433664 RepID=A0A930YPK7_9ACTN|nr:rhodanese-like domain-containing protein [Nocardioides agariphilus]MBF4767805.1 rhodanese-like domain-containing protein [Nocardioides agariphilus]
MPTFMTRAEVEDLIANDQDHTLIDALPHSYYAQQHLPGALNLVETDVATLAAQLLPNKDATVVTYCSNEACPNSKAVARRLEALGYTDVRTYAAGIQDWVQAGNATETSLAS